MTTADAVRLPLAEQIRDLLDTWVPAEVTLRPTAPFGVGPHSPASLATYVDAHRVARAVVVLDLPLSIILGAARTLLPRDLVRASVVEERPTPAMAQDIATFLRAMAPLLHAGPHGPVRVRTLHVSGDRLPELDRARSRCVGRREDLEVTVDGYGSGRLAVLRT